MFANPKTTALLLSFCVAFTSLSLAEDVPIEKATAEELPRFTPHDPDAAMKAFVVHPQFRLELVACEPDVLDPVALAFDPNGRMYVAEMTGYPFPPGDQPNTGRVRLLDDVDNDGRVDRSMLFADGLASCVTDVFPWRGGLFVAAAPDLLYLKDNDGDDVADEQRIVLTGFGIDKAQGLLNNMAWGADGWIYFSANVNAASVRAPDQPETEAVS